MVMVTHSIARVLWCRDRHILIALMPYCLAENCSFWFNERSSLPAIMKGHLMSCYGSDRCVRVCVHAHIHTLKLYFQTVNHQFLYSSPPAIDSCCTFFCLCWYSLFLQSHVILCFIFNIIWQYFHTASFPILSILYYVSLSDEIFIVKRYFIV